MVWSATSAGSREVDFRQPPWRRERSCADHLNCRSQQTPSRREMDSNPRSPVRSLTQTRSNGDVQHPCAASRMTVGTQIGFAIGGFAPVVAAAVLGEGPNAWVPVAPLNSPIGVVASIAAWTARETQHSDARLRVNRRLLTLTPPRFGAKRLEQRRDWRISENMIGVRP